MTFVIFILALCALIVVHEAGHFLAAKAFGIRVDEFAIGFPPRLAAKRFGETEYSINLLLFGGFVRIHGERLEGGSDARSFARRSRFVQALVVVAGILMNFIAAAVLLSTVYMIGMPAEAGATDGPVQNIHLTIVGVVPNSPADRAGLQAGDVVKTLETGTAALPSLAGAQEAQSFVSQHQNESMVLIILRHGAQKNFVAKPAAGIITGEPQKKALGVEFDDVGTIYLSPSRAVAAGTALAWQETTATAQGLWGFFSQLITGHANFSDVSGPVGIANAGASAAAEGASALLFFCALISINLALINLIPIPGLDGGRLLVILIEAIRRRSISERLNAYMTIAGFSLLIALMVIVTYHDLARLIG